MSVAAEKIAEVLALPIQDRAFLVHQLIASLDNVVDVDAEAEWREVIRQHDLKTIRNRLKTFPVVSILGPRQVGKRQMLFPMRRLLV